MSGGAGSSRAGWIALVVLGVALVVASLIMYLAIPTGGWYMPRSGSRYVLCPTLVERFSFWRVYFSLSGDPRPRTWPFGSGLGGACFRGPGLLWGARLTGWSGASAVVCGLFGLGVETAGSDDDREAKLLVEANARGAVGVAEAARAKALALLSEVEAAASPSGALGARLRGEEALREAASLRNAVARLDDELSSMKLIDRAQLVIRAHKELEEKYRSLRQEHAKETKHRNRLPEN